jgi:hypothetical protein
MKETTMFNVHNWNVGHSEVSAAVTRIHGDAYK